MNLNERLEAIEIGLTKASRLINQLAEDDEIIETADNIDGFIAETIKRVEAIEHQLSIVKQSITR